MYNSGNPLGGSCKFTNLLYTPFQTTTSNTNDTLFNNTSSSHSWPANADSSVVSWDVDRPTVPSSTGPTVPTSDSRQKAPESTAPFTPER